MSVSFSYNSGQGCSTEEGCDGSTSNAPWPFELANPDFLFSTVRLVKAITSFDDHVLLAFFPFGLAKPRIGWP